MDNREKIKRELILRAANRIEHIIRKYIVNSDDSTTETDIIKGVVASLPVNVLRTGHDFKHFNGTTNEHDYLFTVAAEGYCWGNHIKHSDLPVDLDVEIPFLDTGEVVLVKYRPQFHEQRKSTGVAQLISGDFMQVYNGDPKVYMGEILFDYERFLSHEKLDLFKCLDDGRVGQLVGRVNRIEEACERNRGKHQKQYRTITDIASELQRRA
jgi:hypothetical protein